MSKKTLLVFLVFGRTDPLTVFSSRGQFCSFLISCRLAITLIDFDPNLGWKASASLLYFTDAKSKTRLQNTNKTKKKPSQNTPSSKL